MLSSFFPSFTRQPSYFLLSTTTFSSTSAGLIFTSHLAIHKISSHSPFTDTFIISRSEIHYLRASLHTQNSIKHHHASLPCPPRAIRPCSGWTAPTFLEGCPRSPPSAFRKSSLHRERIGLTPTPQMPANNSLSSDPVAALTQLKAVYDSLNEPKPSASLKVKRDFWAWLKDAFESPGLKARSPVSASVCVFLSEKE